MTNVEMFGKFDEVITIRFKTEGGSEVDYINADVLNKIETEIFDYFVEIGSTGWLDVRRDIVEEAISQIIKKYKGERK